MATVPAPRDRAYVGSFYITMAAIFAAVAFLGFAPSFWLKLPSRSFAGSPMLYLHGLLFSLWTLFFLAQAVLVANGRLRNHKAWGLAGISLATAMVFVGLAVAVAGLDRRLAMGFGDDARAFAVAPITSAFLFGGLVAAAFGGLVAAAMANWRRPEWHKRLMLVATAALLQPAIARFFFMVNGNVDAATRAAGPPPPIAFTMIPGAVGDLLILAAVLHDWRARGSPHPAYLWGFGAVLLVHLSRPAVSRTDWWLAFADLLVRFNG